MISLPAGAESACGGKINFLIEKKFRHASFEKLNDTLNIFLHLPSVTCKNWMHWFSKPAEFRYQEKKTHNSYPKQNTSISNLRASEETTALTPFIKHWQRAHLHILISSKQAQVWSQVCLAGLEITFPLTPPHLGHETEMRPSKTPSGSGLMALSQALSQHVFLTGRCY